jgi:hypothetical protein
MTALQVYFWALQVYFWLSSLVSIAALLSMRRKMSYADHVGGSIIAGIAFGWLTWPFILWALWKVTRRTMRT